MHVILPFHPKLHKILMSSVMNHAKKPLKNIGTISQIFLDLFERMFFVFFEMSACDVELMTVS